ncbi:MAG: hypothetical protein H7Y37_10255 [Anaerolineae bacterium]|nr:hypothetical protein [Gloeobacterales cyanobacterium ES-bin-313]
MISAIFWLIFCLGLIVGPFLLPIEGPVQLTVAGLGVVLLVLGTFVIVFTKLYVRTKADTAFVRTGRGGALVVLDGGALVIPVLHETVRVPLGTIRLDVDRLGGDALVTEDKLRADLKAQFYLRVQPNQEDVLNAARSLGDKASDPGSIEELIKDKLDSTLRSVAATRTLEQLNGQREEFAAEVKSAVEADLKSNGLTLESVTVSKLDQTNTKLLDPNNVFDAQGLRRIAEITQTALVERNRIERDAEQARTEKDVSTRLSVLEQERIRAEAEAINKAQVAEAAAGQKAREATIQTQKEAESRRVQLEEEERTAQRDIEKQRKIEESQIESQRLILLKRREQELAEVERSQAVETAERQKQTAIAAADADKADADSLRFVAEAERARSEQAVRTVEVTAAAEREGEQKLIAARKEAEQERYRRQVEADVNAYSIQKEAEAKKAAAESEYDARVRLAEGEAKASALRAEGETAERMVAVNVERNQIQVEEARVVLQKQRNDQEIQMLAGREQYGNAALEFELSKLRIEAGRESQVAIARALGEFLAKGNFTMFGDPASAQKMIESYMKGMGLGRSIDGFLAGTEGEAGRLLGKAGENIADLVKNFGARKDGSIPSANGDVPDPSTLNAQTKGEPDKPL